MSRHILILRYSTIFIRKVNVSIFIRAKDEIKTKRIILFFKQDNYNNLGIYHWFAGKDSTKNDLLSIMGVGNPRFCFTFFKIFTGAFHSIIKSTLQSRHGMMNWSILLIFNSQCSNNCVFQLMLTLLLSERTLIMKL